MKLRHFVLLVLATFVVLTTRPAAPVHAWGNILAHPRINVQALRQFEATYGRSPKYARAPLDHALLLRGTGIVTPGWLSVSEEPLTLDVAGWIEHGGFSADEPEAYAALRHFYDPLGMNGGAHYLTDQVPDSVFPNPQIDARRWALDHPENPRRWQRALQTYKLSLESPRDRELNLAYALRALGETMHLVADMALPAHVRNDSHLHEDPIEASVDAAMVDRHAARPLDSRITLQTSSPAALFESVARFTNRTFYSSDTIYNPEEPLVLPRNDETAYDHPTLDELTFDEASYAYYADFDAGRVRMAQWTYSDYMLDLLRAPGARGFHVPAAFADEQASVLIPLAIRANVILLDMFFPTLTLMLRPEITADGQVRYGGELTHEIAQDAAWQPEAGGPGAIRYTGPGQLRMRRGQEVRTLAELEFEGGTVREPVVLDARSAGLRAGDVLFLEVRAGGRVIRSADLRLDGPQISALTPDYGDAGITVTIRGRGFGADQGRSTVTFDGRTARVQEWSDQQIIVTAPEGLRSGPVVVTVLGITSNGVRFTVDTPTAEAPVDAGPRGGCFALEPFDPALPPWLFPTSGAGYGIGWACVIDDEVWAADVPAPTGCASPYDIYMFPSLHAPYDGAGSFGNADGTIRGSVSSNGITLVVQYPEVFTGDGTCPGGTATIVFDQ